MAIESGESTFHQAQVGIIQNDLVLNLDSGVNQSYDGTGTVWFNLEGARADNQGNLMNGASFDREVGGVMSFDGTDDYVQGQTPFLEQLHGSSELSVFAWINCPCTSTYGKIISGAHQGGNNKWDFGLNGDDLFVFDPYDNGSGGVSVSNIVSVDTWTYVGFTYKSEGNRVVYKNAAAQSTVSRGAATVGTTLLRYGIGGSPYAARPLAGKIAIAHIYKKELSAAEVLENYNATRHRFGV